MKFNYIQFKKIVEKSKRKKTMKNYIIGDGLKKERIKKRYTLEQLSSNISSLSLLSKMENGHQVINYEYAVKYSNRLGVTFSECYEDIDIYTEELYDGLKAIILEDSEAVKNFISVRNVNANANSFLECIKHLVVSDFEKCDEKFNDLFDLIASFTTKEVYLFNIILAIYYFKKKNISQCCLYCGLLDGEFEKDLSNCNNLTIITIALLVKCGLLYQNRYIVDTYFEKLISYLNEVGEKDLWLDLRYYKSLYEMKVLKTSEKLTFIKKSNSFNEEYKMALIINNYYSCCDFDEVIKQGSCYLDQFNNKIDNRFEDVLIKVVYSYLYLKQNEQAGALFNDYKALISIATNFVLHFIYHVFTEPLTELHLKNFKKQLRSYECLYFDLEILQNIITSLTNRYTLKAFYKDCYIILNEYTKKLLKFGKADLIK